MKWSITSIIITMATRADSVAVPCKAGLHCFVWYVVERESHCCSWLDLEREREKGRNISCQHPAPGHRAPRTPSESQSVEQDPKFPVSVNFLDNAAVFGVHYSLLYGVECEHEVLLCYPVTEGDEKGYETNSIKLAADVTFHSLVL